MDDDQGSLFDEGPPPIPCVYCRRPIEWQEQERRWMHSDTRQSRCDQFNFTYATPPREAEEVAHARTGDPITSHEAAASLESDAIRRSQYAVLSVFERYGPMHDKQLVERYLLGMQSWGLPKQSVSGIRTRRSELVAKRMIEDSGEKAVLPDSHRRAIIWRVCTNGSSPRR